MPTMLHTVIVQTARIQELADFYGKGLGLGNPQATGGDHLGFRLPNVYLGFDRVEPAPEPTGVISLWFVVDDLGATFRALQELGAGVKYPPRKMPWGAELAVLHDPERCTERHPGRHSVPHP